MSDLVIYAGKEQKRPGCYKRGDVIAVYPYGQCWQPVAPGSHVRILHVDGLSQTAAQKYLESDITNGIRRKVRLDVPDGPTTMTVANIKEADLGH